MDEILQINSAKCTSILSSSQLICYCFALLLGPTSCSFSSSKCLYLPCFAFLALFLHSHFPPPCIALHFWIVFTFTLDAFTFSSSLPSSLVASSSSFSSLAAIACSSSPSSSLSSSTRISSSSSSSLHCFAFFEILLHSHWMHSHFRPPCPLHE